jgi:hypothetical protein
MHEGNILNRPAKGEGMNGPVRKLTYAFGFLAILGLITAFHGYTRLGLSLFVPWVVWITAVAAYLY